MISRLAGAFVALLWVAPLSAQVVLSDGFDGTVLDPAWSLVFRENGTGMTYSQGSGVLRVTDVADSSAADDGAWGVAALRRSVAPVSGDFSATVNMSWDQTSSLAAMDGAVFRLLDATEGVIASVGFRDSWIGQRAAYVGSAGGGLVSTSFNAVPYAGSLVGTLLRSGGGVTALRDGNALATGTSAASVAFVELEFRYYRYPGTFFSTVNVDSVSLTAIPEPAGVAAITAVLALACVAVVRRRT